MFFAGINMLTALFLICSASVTPEARDCSIDSASVVMRLPGTFDSPIACFFHGQAYVAQTTIGQELAEGERVKVICMRSERSDALSRQSHVR